MKEKNKKILKTLGVGALACVGMFGLTGCANVEVSQDKVDSMIETVEKTDGFIDEQTEKMKEQIELLQQQKNNLEKLLEEAKKMTKDDVWNLAMMSDFNLMMNGDGVRDNLIVRGVERSLGLQQDLAYFYNNDDTKVMVQLNGNAQGEIEDLELWYQKIESNVALASVEKVENDFVCSQFEDRGDDANFESQAGIYRSMFGISLFDLTYEDFNHYEILENGNVKLTFVKNIKVNNEGVEGEYFVAIKDYSFEYSLDGKLMSIKMASRIIEKEGEFENRVGLLEESTYNMEYILKYGEINTELVESWVALSEEKRNEQ